MFRIPSSFPGGLLVGATLMYFLDPRRGRARRKRLADVVTHAGRMERRLLVRGARDARHRARGAFERMRPRARTGASVDDVKLEARLRSELGRVVSHSIEVSAHAGIVTLHGPILEREAADAIRTVRRTPGVRRIDDQLDYHLTADIAALQGGERVRTDRWTPAGRLAAMTGGTLLALYGLVLRRGLAGALIASAGGALTARGTFDLPVRRLVRYVTGREEIAVRKTLTIRAPIEQVYQAWSDVENYPRFMQHVHSIECDPRDPMLAHWTIDGPAGIPLRFQTRTTRLANQREIAWRTVPEQPIEHAGVVRFESLREGTRIHVDMTYRPPGGVIGHTVAHVLGWDPKARLDADLVRFKSLLERGHVRGAGGRVFATDTFH